MNNEGNANWHLKYVCPNCSKCRRKFRDPDFIGKRCLWEEQWKIENYDLPKDFGVINWSKYYLGMKTNLCSYIDNRPKSNT